jgi:hypothetical protein
MNQRLEPRFEVAQEVRITLFGEPDIRLTARIRNLSPRGVGLEMQGPVAAGSALKFELDDTLLLGEVIYCRDDGDSFYVGVELEHALFGLGELADTLRAFTDPESGPQHDHAVVNRHRES